MKRRALAALIIGLVLPSCAPASEKLAREWKPRAAMEQRAATNLNWCYFEQEDLLVRRIDPKADYCTEKGGVWLTDGQGDLLSDRMLGKERAALTGSGSGIVVSRKGHILTNQHVVAEQITLPGASLLACW